MSEGDGGINVRRMLIERSTAPRRSWLGPVLLLALGACLGTPPTTIQVQGTVHRVGSRVPVAGAEVSIQWPGVLGGGQSVLRTDDEGRFAVGRTRRRRPPTCAGLAITVQAADFASAYLRHETACGDNVLSFDIPLLPQPR